MYTHSKKHYLPVEIQRDIISRLDIPSIQALRLASSALAAIGAEFVLPQVHLLYRTASFERLALISRHPIISQHVKCLFYECNRLNQYSNWDEWYRKIDKDLWRARSSLIPALTTTPELWDNYRTDMSTLIGSPSHPYAKDELERGWAKYLEFCAEQQDIASRNLDHDQIARAIRSFPKLADIILSHAETSPSSSLIRSYAPGLVLPPRYTNSIEKQGNEPTGLRLFTSLSLFSAEKADLRSPTDTCFQQAALRTLYIGSVSWKIFRATWSAQQARYQTVMAQVTDLRLVLTIAQSGCAYEEEQAACHRFFHETGALQAFLRAAPLLERFKIEWDDGDDVMLNLRSMVGRGGFTWKALRDVRFAVRAEEEELIAFFSRHEKTLRRLNMDPGLTLLGPGASMATLLPRMRDAVQWESVDIWGVLYVASSGKKWYLGDPVDDDGYWFFPEEMGYESEPARSWQAVNDFLMRRCNVNPFQSSIG